MTDDELGEALERIRPIVTNVLGFHALAEDERLSPSPLKRMEWEARVYASGVELARELSRIAFALEDRKP